ncbi:hypothetical protein pEaSNUABM34_00146 [Erwinia phage pEa_SNUABM_34]|nr:hypothetical protein pEaSNUABM34_00146 [Erwinia phage pEa_SNUABM_34]
MLYQNATDIVQTQEADLLPGEVIHEEGVALVWARENGQSFLRLSTGAANEVFAGFALARNMPPAHMNRVETFTIDATKKFTASRVPDAGRLFVKIDGKKADQEADTEASAVGKVGVDGADLYFHADDVGKTVYVQYAYELTVTEARSYTADAPIGGLASNVVGRIGYIKLGNIATSMFDPSVDWSADNVLHPTLGPNGMLTIGGTGTELTGCIIKHSPTSDKGYLIIEMSSSYGA